MPSELVVESESSESSATAELNEGPPTGTDRSRVLGPMWVDAPSPRRLFETPLPLAAPGGLLEGGNAEDEPDLAAFRDVAIMEMDVLGAVDVSNGCVDRRGGGGGCG
jgi:hypothetical protein